MNFKKAIVVTLVVSAMLAALAGPIPASAEAAQEKQQEQQQAKSKEVKIDKKMAAKLQKAVNALAGKEIKLKDVGELNNGQVTAQSADGNYGVHFDPKSGKIWSVSVETTIDKVDKKFQDKALKELKSAYSKKKYVFNKNVTQSRNYDNSKGKLGDYVTYNLDGKDFRTLVVANISEGYATANARIDIDKKELDPKLLKSATEAIKTAFDHQFDVTKAQIEFRTWVLEDDKVTVYMENGKAVSLINEQGNKVTTNKEITEKEATEAVAPLAKKLFNIDITGYEAKWDSLFKDYRFIEKDEITAVRAALDADKNVVYIKSGSRAAAGN
ncbi:hypothetical protein [Paenibacillus apiarius]|uniref:PepSY domain-containing protein n=1 Tax=Paenibacillus apiarius TaxID=46240 RepID=A0ABT4DV52_9BACL|nr:hypothetical protein [Paenibacillus apiarius]MCY9517412.1 hypothetical protein [Paenibacillus apiarius]MCY9520635.1 hypothetical protein [Paenibacillus apiarius]MCY9552973.1 hypothetical protein [Paenibacillus apiarius]MCY9561660.1 hypothetical protein [Paenibacillus apiarius]MCY9687065.1 hypothetical protein [Paenibacillus apiarius]